MGLTEIEKQCKQSGQNDQTKTGVTYRGQISCQPQASS